jgi:hypothetical protein
MRTPARWGLVTALLCLAGTGVGAAQSLTSGSLKGVVRGTDGLPIRNVSLTLEGRGGNTIATFQSGFDGEFRLGLMLPGEYRLLGEQQGYQPVRLVGISVSAGEMTSVVMVLERKPPPIESVQEVVAPGVRVGSARAG